MTTTDKPKRIRNPELRRKLILESALATFSEKGYAGATLREIASRAGVSHGLLKQHFGTKEELFLASVPGTRDWEDVIYLKGEGTLAQRIVAAFGDRREAGTGLDVLVTLLRVASEDVDSGKDLFDTVRRASIDLYAPLMPGKAGALRTEFLMSFLIGVTFSRYMAGSGLIAEMPVAKFKKELVQALDRLLS